MSALLALTVAGGSASRAAAQTSFGNTAPITVTDGSATPAASAIFVAGLPGGISAVTVTLQVMNVPGFADLDFLLVGPGGQKFVIASDAGGFNTISGVTITLSDAAGSALPSDVILSNLTYRPTNYDAIADVFGSPAPAGPYSSPSPFGTATFASVFNSSNPNGIWTLYVIDDAIGGGTSTITQGWKILITTRPPTATVVGSSLNPSFTSAPNNLVTFTATVTSGGSPVTPGTVTFTEGVTTLAANVALNGSGQAAFSTSAMVEGTHMILATFNGTAVLAGSSGNVTQVVNNHTVVTLPTFCNPGAIAVPDGLPASVYPSNIYVAGVGGSLTEFTVTLSGIDYAVPDDLDLLLVGPNGEKFVLMSDVGGANLVSGLSLTLSDAGASLLPDATVLGNGTWRPTAYNAGGMISFPAPAPSGPYTFAAPFGAGTLQSTFGGSTNGTWSLYAVDDLLGDGGGSLTGGWCVSFDTGMAGVEDGALPDVPAMLARPMPDPMRSSTTLRYALARAAEARLEVFDASGRRVRTLRAGFEDAGWHEATWDGRDAAGLEVEGGVYFARLHAAGSWSVQRIVRLK